MKEGRELKNQKIKGKKTPRVEIHQELFFSQAQLRFELMFATQDQTKDLLKRSFQLT